MNAVANNDSSFPFVIIEELPTPYGLEVVSHPLKACRKGRALHSSSSIYSLRILIDTVHLDVVKYTSSDSLSK